MRFKIQNSLAAEAFLTAEALAKAVAKEAKFKNGLKIHAKVLILRLAVAAFVLCQLSVA